MCPNSPEIETTTGASVARASRVISVSCEEAQRFLHGFIFAGLILTGRLDFDFRNLDIDFGSFPF